MWTPQISWYFRYELKPENHPLAIEYNEQFRITLPSLLAIFCRNLCAFNWKGLVRQFNFISKTMYQYADWVQRFELNMDDFTQAKQLWRRKNCELAPPRYLNIADWLPKELHHCVGSIFQILSAISHYGINADVEEWNYQRQFNLPAVTWLQQLYQTYCPDDFSLPLAPDPFFPSWHRLYVTEEIFQPPRTQENTED